MQAIMKKIKKLIALLTIVFLAACEKDSSSVTSNSSSGNSANGSLARFITVGNYLYTVDVTNLKTYDITNPATPILKNSTNVGFGIETILPYNNKLFIGSNANMFIYSIADPATPTKLSQVTYFVRGRDPIIVKDTIAYSTLRFFGSGTLSIINVKNELAPLTVNNLPLNNPYGLGIKDSALYICEGNLGLKIFSTHRPTQPYFKKLLSNNETFYDVIIENNLLFCYIKGGIGMYDITNIFEPVFISFIKN
jgi:hypothetical protein